MAMTAAERSKAFRERVKNGYIPKTISRKGSGLSKSDLKLRKYGISRQDYEEMYRNQNGLCAICGQHFEKLFVDHDHETDYVRALLCPQCNFGLGSFSDNENRLRKAAIYLSDHRIRYQTEKLISDAQRELGIRQ